MYEDKDEAVEYLRTVRYSIIQDYNKGEISESIFKELIKQISNHINDIKNLYNSKNS